MDAAVAVAAGAALIVGTLLAAPAAPIAPAVTAEPLRIASPARGHVVTFEVAGSAPTAVVTHSSGGGQSRETGEVALPWSARYEWVAFHWPVEASIWAVNGPAGWTGCRIVVDGQVLAESSTTYPGGALSCRVPVGTGAVPV